MAIGGSILIDIGANVARLKQDMGNVVKEIESTKSKIDKAFSGFQRLTQFSAIGLAGIQLNEFLMESVTKALEAEKAFNQLQIGIENLGISYDSVNVAVEESIRMASEYAIVQEEEVASVLQKLVFLTGDLEKAQANLTMVYDLAYMKGIDAGEAADIIGRAYEGNIERLGRMFPEIKNYVKLLGDQATAEEKAAYALALIGEKSAGATDKMTEHEKSVRSAKKAWEDFKETTGVALLKVWDFLDGLRPEKLKKIIDLEQDQKQTAEEILKAQEAKYANEKMWKDAVEASNKEIEKQLQESEKLAEAWKKASEQLSKDMLLGSFGNEFDRKIEEISIKYKELTDQFSKAAGFDKAFLDAWKNAELFKIELERTKKEAEDLRGIFDDVADNVKDFLKTQIDGLQEWREQAVKSYEDAIKAAADYYNQARSLEESLRQGRAFREKLGAKQQTPMRQMEAEAAALKKLFESAVSPEDYEKVRLESEKYLTTWERYKNEFGGWTIFSSVDDIHRQTLNTIESMMNAYDNASNSAMAFADNQLWAISEVDRQIMDLQNQLRVVDEMIAATKTVKIDTSNAASQIQYLINQIAYMNSLIGVNSGPYESGNEDAGNESYYGNGNYNNYSEALDIVESKKKKPSTGFSGNMAYHSVTDVGSGLNMQAMAVMGDAIVTAINRKMVTPARGGDNIGITMNGVNDPRKTADELRRMQRYRRL